MGVCYKHEWESTYFGRDEYMVCKKCGLTRDVCSHCDKGIPFYSYYNVFDFSLGYNNGVLNISSEHNDNDEMKISYCPMCGKKLES